MAKDEERTRPSGEQAPSVLDAPEYISGVAGKKKRQEGKRGEEECESVLEGPDCIEGVQQKPQEKSGRK